MMQQSGKTSIQTRSPEDVMVTTTLFLAFELVILLNIFPLSFYHCSFWSFLYSSYPLFWFYEAFIRALVPFVFNLSP